MKALMILIVAAGLGDAGLRDNDQVLQVQQIEFSDMEACQKAAERLTVAGRRATDYQKVFAVESGTNRVLAPAPVVMAECVVR